MPLTVLPQAGLVWHWLILLHATALCYVSERSPTVVSQIPLMLICPEVLLFLQAYIIEAAVVRKGKQ